MKFETNSNYNYLLCAVFNRPMEECNSVEPPNRGFMSLLIWEHLTGKQFDYLYLILNTKTLDKEDRYTMFNNTILTYNSELKETNRIKKIKQDKVYREANKDKIAERNRKYLAKNKDTINAQRRARYRRDKNGTNN